MTLSMYLRAAPVALALFLSACGGKSEDSATAYCPAPFTVQDAGRLTHFKDGPGRDPRDVEYEAALAGVGYPLLLLLLPLLLMKLVIIIIIIMIRRNK